MFLTNGTGRYPTSEIKLFTLIPLANTPVMKMKGFQKVIQVVQERCWLVYSAELINSPAFGQSTYTTVVPNSDEVQH